MISNLPEESQIYVEELAESLREEDDVFYENEITYHDTIDTLRELEADPEVEMYHTDQLGGALKGMQNAIINDTNYSEMESLRGFRKDLNEAQKSVLKAANQISEPVEVTEKISGKSYQKGHLDTEYTDLTGHEIWANSLQKQVEKNTAEDETPLTVMLTYDGGFTKESEEQNLEGEYAVALPPDLITYLKQ